MVFNSTTNINEIRAFSGAPESLISDSDIKVILDKITKNVRELYNINFTPIKTIEVSNGNNNFGYIVKKRFPLKILELKIGNESIDIDKVHLKWNSGIINIQNNTSNNVSRFNVFPGQTNSVKIKYINAWMDKTDIVTENTEALTVGENVDIIVEDISGLNKGEWVWIEGMDRRTEVAKITVVNLINSTITVDKLSQTHEEGSLITLLKKSELLSSYVLYESAISVANNAIGKTYELSTGYTIEDVQVQVGVPWTHWKENREGNIKKANELKMQIQNKLLVVG